MILYQCIFLQFAMIMYKQGVLIHLELRTIETKVRGLISKQDRQLHRWVPLGI